MQQFQVPSKAHDADCNFSCLFGVVYKKVLIFYMYSLNIKNVLILQICVERKDYLINVSYEMLMISV
jgi:hypothetical protein